nr:MAG TPA: hypothetical protein [Caudoviricetes sp.]
MNAFRSRSSSQRGVRNPRTASVRLQCQPLSPIHSSGWGPQLATSKGKPMSDNLDRINARIGGEA